MGKKFLVFCKSCEKNEEIFEMEKTQKYDEPATFESAISATNFGRFNILLIFVTIPIIFATLFETTTIAYVIPVAQCDLDLSLEDKGYLISATYMGMVLSALFWGYLSDTLGRKRVMIVGLILNFIFSFVGGVAQNFATLLFCKFVGGFLINGPYAISTTILSEFHSAKYRARILLMMGAFFSLANVFLPLISMGVFSVPMDFTLFNGYLNLHSWNVLILVTTLPILISVVGFVFLIPETPKFLMSSGNNEEALKVFRHVYAMNNKTSGESFPIHKLVDENKLNPENSIPKNKLEAFKNGLKQMKPAFCSPHLRTNILICTMSIGNLMGSNSLRLWMPQLFTTINNYNLEHENESPDICTILATLQNHSANALVGNEDTLKECTVNFDETDVIYYNLMAISVVNIIGFFFVQFLINAMGKKKLYLICGTLAGLSAMSLIFAQNIWTVTFLDAIFATMVGIMTNVLITITVDLFPTSLRTTAVAISLMIGRLGSVLGNLIFPYLLVSGCLPPFLFVGATTAAGSWLVVLLKTKIDMKALE